MTFIAKPIRIEPAFDDPGKIRAMFERYAPYRALAAYAPEGIKDEAHEEAMRPVDPWFREDWALGGEPLVDGADLILHNKRFLEAAKAAFGTSCVNPEFVAVNINGPRVSDPGLLRLLRRWRDLRGGCYARSGWYPELARRRLNHVFGHRRADPAHALLRSCAASLPMSVATVMLFH